MQRWARLFRLESQLCGCAGPGERQFGEMHLEDYFAHIGYNGPRTATWSVLAALQAAHVRTIPFENLTPWVGDRVELGLPELERKLVHERRGGYCYEHNTWFAAVLRELGFAVQLRLARVRWQVPAEVTTGRSHLCLRVTVDGRDWLVDTGFGGIGPTTPIALDIESPQLSSHETRRLRFEGEGVVLHQVDLGAENWADVYRIQPERTFPVDVEMANWFTSTHPNSLFRRSLIVTQVQPDHRRLLLNREFTRRYVDGRVERRLIGSLDALRTVLVEEFGLRANDPILARLELPPAPVGG